MGGVQVGGGAAARGGFLVHVRRCLGQCVRWHAASQYLAALQRVQRSSFFAPAARASPQPAHKWVASTVRAASLC